MPARTTPARRRPGAGATRKPGRINFNFKVEKFADAMAYLAERISDLTTLKAAKLLYFADRDHLLRHGRPIIGDWYVCMKYGPVPSTAYDLLKELRAPEGAFSDDGIAIVQQRIRPLMERGKHPTFVRTNDAPLDALSESECRSLERIAKQHGGTQVDDLVDLTHKQAPWKTSDRLREREIDYRWFFDDVTDKKNLRELMEIEQEGRDFVVQFIGQR